MRKLNVVELNRMNVEEFKESSKVPMIVLLDDVRSMYNVGSVLRTSDAFRVECVCLCGITACPPHPEIHKTALGAEDSVDWKYCKDIREEVVRLKQTGYIVAGVEQVEGSIMLDHLDLGSLTRSIGKNKIAVIMGNEVKGVNQEVVDMCDFCIEIPQYGTKHSLNVSTAAGIVIWELFKQMRAFE